jgi:SAM-dependent methyltransferase
MENNKATEINTAKIKQVLAFVREGDFAHAGEDEAISLVFEKITKNADRLVLDVGCGLGGTANLIQIEGWGKLTGIDVNEHTVDHAKKTYPEIDFFEDDILAPKLIDKKFDLIYLFNVFYALTNQEKAIEEITKLANQDGQLIIFDYTDRGNYELFRPPKAYDVLPKPINLPKLENSLEKNGWQITSFIDLTAKYKRWYEDFVSKISKKKEKIIEISDKPTYQFVFKTYSSILKSIKSDVLGGCVLYCQRVKIQN